MNIDQMTIGELKQINQMFNAKQSTNDKPIGRDIIGKYAIVRSRNEGVNAGSIKEMDETGIVLADARRIWYHKPADTSMSWYEGVAISGLSDDSKISCTVPVKVIVEDYSVTVCTDAAENSIRKHKTHEQS